MFGVEQGSHVQPLSIPRLTPHSTTNPSQPPVNNVIELPNLPKPAFEHPQVPKRKLISTSLPNLFDLPF